MNNLTYSQYIAESFRKFWDIPSMTDYPIRSFNYSDVAYGIRQLWFAFDCLNIKKGDKVAICGMNSINWGITYLATTTYGTVAVPILHEFTTDKIIHLIEHSDSKALFISETIWDEMQNSLECFGKLSAVYSLDDFSLLFSGENKLPYVIGSMKLEGCTAEEFSDKIYHYSPDELISINYTSGTMSSPKGVMIPSRALSSNLAFALEVVHMLRTGDNVVSLLPLAHMYGIMYDFLGAIVFGVNVHFMTQPLTVKNMLSIFKKTKPCIIIDVPLLIETLIRDNIFKYTHKTHFKPFYRLFKPLVDKLIGRVIKMALGDNFYEIIIGGAELDAEVERALIDYHIPFTVGYGMTECSPIITYSDQNEHIFRSCGKTAPRMQIEVRDGNQIYVMGDNVMLGYYGNEQATEEAFDNGWMKTGDVGYFDEDGNLFLEGRSDLIIKNDGKNINPKEIEEVINSSGIISESIVYLDKNENRLKAIVYPSAKRFKTLEDLSEMSRFIDDERKKINGKLPVNEQISSFIIYGKPFSKTLKGEIKRYLYVK